MTYHQWLQHCRRQQEAAVPDIRERLPDIPSHPHRTPAVTVLRVVAVSATACVLLWGIGYACLLAWPSEESTSPPFVDERPEVVLHQAVQAAALLHTGIPEQVYTAMDGYVGARVIHLSADTAPAEHNGCTGVYYHMTEKTVFCADHVVLAVLKKLGKTVSKVGVHFYHPILKKIVFTCWDGGRTSYCYDIQTDTLHQLPVSLYHCAYHMEANNNIPYVLLHKMGGTRDDLYLIDLNTAHVTNILKDSQGRYVYTPMDDSQLSPCGQYAFYTLSEGGPDHVNSPARTTVVYHTATGKSTTFTGEIWMHLPESGRLLIKNPDGFAVYDIPTNTTTPFAKSGLPTQYAYYEQRTDIYTEYDYRLLLVNRNTEQTELLSEEYIVAHVRSADARYLYYYVRGEDSLRVRDLATGEEQRLPLEQDPSTETEGETRKNLSLQFYLWLDNEQGQIWLSYQDTQNPREDPEQIRQAREKAPYYALDKLRETGKFTSLLSLEPLLRKYPQYVTAYEGDGFLFLDYSGLFADEHGLAPGNLQIALEDYDIGTFQTINHSGDNPHGKFSAGKKHSLPTDAQQRIRALLAELNIPIQQAYRDYRLYLTDDPAALKRVLLADVSCQRMQESLRNYMVRERNGYLGAQMSLESADEKAELYTFIDFTDSLSYKKMEDEVVYSNKSQFTLSCSYNTDDMYDILVGKLNGQPFITKNGYVANMTETDYSRWTAWLRKQAAKGHVDSK